ncbi:uncharacterized protein LOC132304923 [Cornus florida]|uniref:uncharacterized protein LOC132304923 n=1 Tax=Cornus florida TaxID=4283 RepID=UPI0028A1F168|nr:uncharacterized protein LOC132304923 [Cornus florida]
MLVKAEDRDQRRIKRSYKQSRGEASVVSVGGFRVPQAPQPVALSVGSYPGRDSAPTASEHQSGHQGSSHSWVRVLVDTGASHSFISTSFAHSLGLKFTQRDSFLCVDTPVGGLMSLDRVCQGCATEIARWTLERVLVFTPTGDCFHFVGDRYDSHSMMIFSIDDWNRHKSYLASLLADDDSSSGRVYPAVVVEFLDVFPEELTDLLPLQEVIFAIGVIPGTALLFMAPYCMAQAELDELKAQLDDLKAKGFIRPSASP